MDIVIRAFFAFIFVFLITRLIGRRELSSLEPFDLILLVVVGDLIQQGVTQSDMSFTGARARDRDVRGDGARRLLRSASASGACEPLLDPQPLIVVQDGEVIEANLRKERMTVGELARGGAAPEDRLALGGEVGGARVERPRQLHPERADRAALPDRSRGRPAADAARRARGRRGLLRASRSRVGAEPAAHPALARGRRVRGHGRGRRRARTGRPRSRTCGSPAARRSSSCSSTSRAPSSQR